MKIFLLLALLCHSLQTPFIPRAEFTKARYKVKAKRNAKGIGTNQQYPLLRQEIVTLGAPYDSMDGL